MIDDSTSHYLPDLGREAVIIFFVLSGYVIAYTCDLKKPTLSEYLIARAARIYSVALPVLLLAFFSVFAYSNFTNIEFYQLDNFHIYITLHSFFLGEIWTLSETPPWLTPYWSLSYEVWYYIFFASVYFFSGMKRVLIGGMVFLLLGYKLWLLLPIWLSGVALYHYQKKYPVNIKAARAVWFASISILGLYKYFDLDIALRVFGNDIWPFDFLSLGSADRYLGDYVVAIIIIINFHCARYFNFNSLIKYQNPIRTISNYTFTLYLVHFLVLSIWIKLYNHNPSSISDIFLLVLTISISTFALGQITEHKKYWFSNIFTYIYERTLGKLKLDIKNPYSQI